MENKKTWEYIIGFSAKEFQDITGKNFGENEIEKLLIKEGLDFKKVIVCKAIEETMPKCLNAVYKNPSSMREDAPNAFSCSSLISYLYTMAGVWMPSISIDKYVFSKKIKKEELKFGDLVFSNTGIGKIYTESIEYDPGTKVLEGIDHVALYLTENKILHSSKKEGRVLIENIENLQITSKIIGFGRVAEIEEKRYVIFIPEKLKHLKTKLDLIKYMQQIWAFF